MAVQIGRQPRHRPNESLWQVRRKRNHLSKRALKFYSSVRLDIRRKEYLKSGDTIVGNHVLVKVVKNKVAPPFKKAEFDIIYSEGISREGSVIDVALFYGILQKQGAWISYGETKIGQGREAARDYLKQNPKPLSEIEQKVKEQAAQAT